MVGNSTIGRRSFLKKAGVSSAVVGGVVTSAQPAAAASQTLTVEGDGSGDYFIYVNDDSATGGTDLESDDTVTNYTCCGKSAIEGTVYDGDVDTYHFDGQITSINASGNLIISVSNPNGINLGGELTVEGSEVDYAVGVTDSLTKTSDCESTEDISNGDLVNGYLNWSDTDTFQGDGTIDIFSVWPGGSVTVNHDI